MAPKAYGYVFSSTTGRMTSEAVGRVAGAILELNDDGNPEALRIHLEGHGTPRELILPVEEAMYLLAVLKAVQLDHDIPCPEDAHSRS